MKKTLLALVALTAFFTSCKKDNNNSIAGTFKSDDIQMYGGKAKTWVKISGNGAPEQIAISIDDAAMNSLPAGDGGGEPEAELIIPFPQQYGASVFDHALVGWNPHGHEPAGIYDLPHFDFHFYTSTVEEQMSIPFYEQDSLKFKNYPAVDYIPANYIAIPGGVPMMGTHWVDVTSPEMNGTLFTQTFLLGSYNGKVTFYEPMITLDFLENNSGFERSIPQAAKVQKAGYYPTKMKISRHDGVTEIILDGFINKQAS